MENGGIPTVIIAIRAFQERLAAMSPPRVLITPHLMGRPVGAPGDRNTQREVVLRALSLLEKVRKGGAVDLFTPAEDKSRREGKRSSG